MNEPLIYPGQLGCIWESLKGRIFLSRMCTLECRKGKISLSRMSTGAGGQFERANEPLILSSSFALVKAGILAQSSSSQNRVPLRCIAMIMMSTFVP